jgi:hypothetical protein
MDDGSHMVFLHFISAAKLAKTFNITIVLNKKVLILFNTTDKKNKNEKITSLLFHHVTPLFLFLAQERLSFHGQSPLSRKIASNWEYDYQ